MEKTTKPINIIPNLQGIFTYVSSIEIIERYNIKRNHVFIIGYFLFLFFWLFCWARFEPYLHLTSPHPPCYNLKLMHMIM